MKKIVVLGDAHIRDQTWSRVRLYGDSLLAAAEVVDYAVETGATLVQSGDLFDVGLNQETPRNILDVSRLFNSVPAVVHTEGNHDRPKPLAGRETPKWADILGIKKPYQDNIGKTEVGTSWFYEEDRVHEVDGIKYMVLHHVYGKAAFDAQLDKLVGCKFDVLVIHQYMRSLMGIAEVWEVDDQELAERLKDTGCRLVICGHTHVAKDWVVMGVTMVSPGATYPESLNASGYVYRFPEINFDEADIEVVWHPIKSLRQVERIVVEDSPEGHSAALAKVDALIGETVTANLPAQIITPVLTVVCEPVPGFKARMEERAGSLVCLVFSWVANTKAGDQLLQMEDSSEEADDVLLEVIRQSYPPGMERDILMGVQSGGEVEVLVENALKEIERRVTDDHAEVPGTH